MGGNEGEGIAIANSFEKDPADIAAICHAVGE
jgi:hypothetical protein